MSGVDAPAAGVAEARAALQDGGPAHDPTTEASWSGVASTYCVTSLDRLRVVTRYLERGTRSGPFPHLIIMKSAASINLDGLDLSRSPGYDRPHSIDILSEGKGRPWIDRRSLPRARVSQPMDLIGVGLAIAGVAGPRLAVGSRGAGGRPKARPWPYTR